MISGKATSVRANRCARAVESFASAADCIGPIEPGLSLFAVTHGQFGMREVALHLITELGSCSVSVWAWAMSSSIDVFEAMLVDPRVDSARLIADSNRAKEPKNAVLVDSWRHRFGADSVRTCSAHAKIVRFWTADRRVLLRGSMNFGAQPRFDQFDITEGDAAFDLVAATEDTLPLVGAPVDSKRSASLGLFDGLRVWSA